jgi:YVTN family beta-propeller protein
MKAVLICILFIIMAGLFSCSLFDHDNNQADIDHSYLLDDGLFLLNEGNYMAGNGSLSFYSFKSSTIHNDLFNEINGRPLGDIPNSVTLSGDRVFIVVNNSGKIEVTERATLRSLSTIKDLGSPRRILAVGGNKAYVTNLRSKKITILDLENFSVSGYIDIRRSSEAITMVRNKVYVSSWESGDEIIVIDPLSNKVSDSIRVGNEPESMAVDKNQRLWVLCSGGYSGQNYPKLVTINTLTDKVETVFQFPVKSVSPTSLCINSTGDTLYYIDRGLRRMSISDTELPSAYFVPAAGRMFYKISADIQNGIIFATNAMDYQQKGFLMRINSKGEITDSVRAGIIPASHCSNRFLN